MAPVAAVRSNQAATDIDTLQIAAWDRQEQQMSRQGLEREVLGRPEQHHSPRPIRPLVLDLKRLLTKRQLDFAASHPTRLPHSARQHLTAANPNSDRTADIRVPVISTRLTYQQLATPNDSKRPLGQTRIR